MDADPPAAEAARRIVAGTTLGSLATVAVDPAGYPFGSLVAYAVDDAGSPVLCLSDLAEHVHNVRQDRRASLLAAEVMGGGDPLALGRVTLIGDVHPAPDEDVAQLRERYLAAHPDAFYVDFADFTFYRLVVRSIRYVGGFGRMSWVDVEAYRAAFGDAKRA